jgi:hypothetical protein
VNAGAAARWCRVALAAVALTGLVGCSGGSTKPLPAFCTTARTIRQENSNVPETPPQQVQNTINELDQLASVSRPAVKAAPQTMIGYLQPLASGQAVRMTATAAADRQKKQDVAEATVDNALRDGCGLDISVLDASQAQLRPRPHDG